MRWETARKLLDARCYAANMARLFDIPRSPLTTYAAAVSEAITETLWPTRCAVCDIPGKVLCDTCQRALGYVDWWRACHRCGAPLARVQCTECNAVTLAASGRTEPAFDGCASSVVFDDASARIVRTWKDAGERRLASNMAALMASVIPPTWHTAGLTIVPIPASTAALRRRGFDHGRDLAEALAACLDYSIAPLLSRPRVRDQRSLTRRERLGNMEGRFRVLPGATTPSTALIVDDVFTTGATLSAASDALRAAGCSTIVCVTFARVF